MDKIAHYKEEILKIAKERKKKDPFLPTKTVAMATILAVPGDMVFDLTSDAVYTYKKHKNKFMRGLQGQKFKKIKSIKNMVKSKEFKGALNMFKDKQKGFAIPASLAFGAVPIGYAYMQDRKNLKR